jgi:PleD family two-component response regulator
VSKNKRSTHHQPLILLAGSEAWQTHKLSSALADGGFRVVTATDEREACDAAHVHHPHAIILDIGLAPPGYGVCLTLRAAALATPIILICPGEPTRAEHHAALRAGAWDVFGTPIDLDTLLLRLTAFVEPKVELERVSDECLVDRVSGLYNPAGLRRRAAELAALAARHGLTLACAVFRPAQKLPNHAAGDRMALTFRGVGRASDAIGRTGPTEFAVFAPATNTWAAARLMSRITDNVEQEFGYLRERMGRLGLRSGYSAALAAHKISPPALLARARSALELH